MVTCQPGLRYPLVSFIIISYIAFFLYFKKDRLKYAQSAHISDILSFLAYFKDIPRSTQTPVWSVERLYAGNLRNVTSTDTTIYTIIAIITTKTCNNNNNAQRVDNKCCSGNTAK